MKYCTRTIVVFTGLMLLAHRPLAGRGGEPENAADPARVILRRYADAWRGEGEMAFERDFVVAFWVRGEGGGEYHAILSPSPGAAIEEGIPDRYDVGFVCDIDWLRRIDRGEMSALTAMGRARSTDSTPLDFRIGPLLKQRAGWVVQLRRLVFHFWTRTWPEIVPFGEAAARTVHGGNASVLVYDEAFRSAWYQLEPGMHINADPDDQVNDFPQLVVVIRGRFTGRFDGEERTLTAGQAVFIPAGMRHEFLAHEEEYGEFIWIAFGEGA